MNKKYQAAINELHRAYDFFLEHFNAGDHMKKAEPIITIASKGRKKALGWFWANKWKNGGEDRFPEINISAETLDRSVDDIMRTLLHEMVHMHNSLLGLKDCNAAQYHNKIFRDACPLFGQTASKYPGRGYALTELDEKGKAAVAAFRPDESVFNITRLGSSDGDKVKKPSPYITIALKRDDYEAILDDLKSEHNAESYNELVKQLIDKAQK